MSYTDEDGKRHQLSLRVQEKRTAEKLYRKKVTEIAQGLNFATNAKNVPLSNLATEFLRRKKSNKCFKQDVSMVNQVVDHFGKGTSIKAIKPSDINAYVDSLDENYAHASKNKRLLILKGMFAIADENYNLKNPNKHIKISKPYNA
jgi:site-specific recombinase XerD